MTASLPAILWATISAMAARVAQGLAPTDALVAEDLAETAGIGHRCRARADGSGWVR
jgi:hypothetical protein